MTNSCRICDSDSASANGSTGIEQTNLRESSLYFRVPSLHVFAQISDERLIPSFANVVRFISDAEPPPFWPATTQSPVVARNCGNESAAKHHKYGKFAANQAETVSIWTLTRGSAISDINFSGSLSWTRICGYEQRSSIAGNCRKVQGHRRNGTG